MSFTIWCPISNTIIRYSSRLISSHDLSLFVDLGCSNSLPDSVDNQPLMAHSLQTSFPMTSPPTINVHDITDKLDEQLENLQAHILSECIGIIMVPII